MQIPKLAMPRPNSGAKTAREDKQADMELATFVPATPSVMSARTSGYQEHDAVMAWQPETLSQHCSRVEMDQESIPSLEQLQAELGSPRLFTV